MVELFRFGCFASLLLGCSAGAHGSDDSQGMAGSAAAGTGGSAVTSSGGQATAAGGTTSAAGAAIGGAAMGGTSSSGASSGGNSASCGGSTLGGTNQGGAGPSGTPGVWEPMLNWPKETQPISGDGILADPARHSDFYFFYEEYQTNGQPRHVLKSTDYGQTWNQVDTTPVVGNPWGVTIDPNPCRDPNTPPTMYTPAGYGDGGVWKSSDGGVTWANLFEGSSNGVVPKTGGGTTTFPPDKNSGYTDFYQIHVLPDDPPNHILVTYHYGSGLVPLGESKDGGASWEVHLIPAGDSHYVFGIDASTWVIISGEGSNGGIYRTTTAGRVDGKISTSAWTKVDDLEHNHGSFTPWRDPSNGFLYFAGKSGIRQTQDGGATWASVYDGSMSTLAATGSNLYAEPIYDTSIQRAALADPTTWETLVNPTNDEWWGGIPPFGAVSVFDGEHWVILEAEHGKCSNNCQPARSPLLANGEIWRYVEE